MQFWWLIRLFRWNNLILQPLDEPTCVQRRVVILWSLEHEQNWANGVSVYPHQRCGTRSLIRSSILLQAANISGKNWKHSCLGKPTHQPLRTIEEWTYLLTFKWQLRNQKAVILHNRLIWHFNIWYQIRIKTSKTSYVNEPVYWVHICFLVLQYR